MSNRQDIEKYVSLCTDKVRKNIEIISKEDLGQDFLLHVSPDNMSKKLYVPWIGYRQDASEDRTVPRITVSDSIVGCILGYSQLFRQVINYSPNPNWNGAGNNYKQGLYIHEINFEYALKPNNKLVYDQSKSNEHWLVTYNEETRAYKGHIIGKLFVSNLTIIPNQSQYGSTWVAEIYMEIMKKEGILFNKNNFISQGYWSFKITLDKNTKHDKDKQIEIQEISKDVFYKSKEISASMLSYNPVYKDW